MAIKIVSTATTIKEKIVVERRGDFGKVTKEEFTGEFKRLNREQTNELLQQQTDFIGSLAEGEYWRAQDYWIRHVLVGFTGVQDENGNDVPFSDETLALLLQDAAVLVACIEAWKRVAKLKEQQEKN